MEKNTRQYSYLDRCLLNFDQVLSTLVAKPRASARPNPADTTEAAQLSEDNRRYVAGLMRVNHTGEVCAQALYQGQALTTSNEKLRSQLAQAAHEESDHLAWCAERLIELKSHPSRLNPLLYAGSLAMGMTAGWLGDAINLGFLAETERQVEQHLKEHLQKLPASDERSRKILQKMCEDEAQHAAVATEAGGAELPSPVPFLMRCLAKIMTKTTFWI